MTRCGDPFFTHDSMAHNDERILIHTKYDNIQYLSDNTTLFSDGTFKMAPIQFTQLFTVLDVVSDYPVPLTYAVTTNR